MNLSIENIKKSYDEKMAVDDISFEIDRGETVGILGPNGAGKTTLFYIIAVSYTHLTLPTNREV